MERGNRAGDEGGQPRPRDTGDAAARPPHDPSSLDGVAGPHFRVQPGNLPVGHSRAGTLVRERAATAGGTPSRDAGPVSPPPAPMAAVRRLAASRPARHCLLLAGYLAAGVALTWPRATYLAGHLPALRDAAGYVWGFWWVAHQITHLGNPWSTTYLAAPVGTQLGYHTLMPLPGLLMMPVTLIFGPSASYNLLSVACPGLLCYAMYRTARLWLPASFDAVIAGAFFGLSSSLAWRSWYQVNLALGALFLPMALEAAVRLRRRPGRRQAIILGLVLGAAMLTDQESAVLTAVLAGLALAPWLARQPSWGKLRQAAVAAVAAAVAASPQIIAMIQQAAAGAAAAPPAILAKNYGGSGAGLLQMVAPSPRLASYGLGGLTSFYYQGRWSLVVTGYGAVLSLAAVAGLVVAWRRATARLLGLLWLGSSLLALGAMPWIVDRPYVPLAQWWHGARLSLLMPYTWFVRLPGLANFREADRFTELGLVAAALLAGAAVGWLRTHAKPALVAVLAIALLEAGWAGNTKGHGRIGMMPTALPSLDGPIAADHSGSIVVDVPFGIRGGLPVTGEPFPPEAMVLATADGHPLADAFISRIPASTIAGIRHHAFYAALLNIQNGGRSVSPALLRAARSNARAMHIGWVLVWVGRSSISDFLRQTGFRLTYRADGVSVYRPAGQPGRPRVPHVLPGRAHRTRAPAGSRAPNTGTRAPGGWRAPNAGPPALPASPSALPAGLRLPAASSQAGPPGLSAGHRAAPPRPAP